jgi:hypothetical protein
MDALVGTSSADRFLFRLNAGASWVF